MTSQNQYYQPLELIAWQSRFAVAAPTVSGTGNQHATLMIIGEIPSLNEDQHDEPFVDRAEQLLTAMIKSIGYQRDDVYFANVFKSHPPENCDPTAEEIATCTLFLNQQIALIKPRLLLAVGHNAARFLLNSKSSLESLRGQIHHFGEERTPLIVTYHPTDLLRSPSDKKMAYLDLQFAQKTLNSLK